jgi:hypothetical protein
MYEDRVLDAVCNTGMAGTSSLLDPVSVSKEPARQCALTASRWRKPKPFIRARTAAGILQKHIRANRR